MKKSILLVLALPLILCSCTPTSTTQKTTENGTESSSQTTGGTTTGGNSQTGGQTSGGTETGGGSTGGDEEYTESTDKSTTQLGLSAGDKPTAIQFCDEITLTCGSGTNSNPPAFYSNELRFYVNNTLTISNSKGKITDIKLRYTDSTGDNVNSFTSDVGSMPDYQTWKGSSSSVTFTVVNTEDGKTGHLKLASLKITYTSHLGGGTTGGGTTGGGTTGGGTTGGDIQAGNGNTSHSFTSPWEGIQKDIVYQMFKGNLPHLTDFNQYALGDWDGSTIPYFNPYIESNWSKDAQKDYDLALKEMGYSLTTIEPYVDGNGNEFPDTPVNCYSKGSFRVRTSHYAGSHNVWYFDVYAWNEYEPADPNFTVKSELDRSKITLKSGYQALNYSGGGYNYSANAVCKYSTYGMQFDAESEITITGDLHNINILFVENAYSCVVYAGSSASNLSPVYNDACNYKLPSGTKVVKIKTLEKECIIENIAVN